MSAGSGNIEDRIVSIKFDNEQFEQKIASTINSLDQLGLKIASANQGKAFDDLNRAANSVNLSNIGAGVDSIASKLSAMGAIGFTVVQNLTNRLLGFAGQFVQSDILGPLITGGKTRALALQQANFQFQGLGLNVTEVMKDANDAVLGTAFSLSDAASAAAQLGAAGIAAGPQLEGTLRGIAGVAALTGTGFSDMSYIFTQAAAQGKLTTQQIDEFSTRGLNVTNALATQLNTTSANVRNMVSKGQVDFPTFAAAMNAAFGQHATEANQTYTGSLANMHTALARIGALLKSPELVQSRDLFNAVTPQIDNLKTALTPLIFTLAGIRGNQFLDIQHFFEHLNLQPAIFGFQNIAQGLQNIVQFFKAIFDLGKLAFKDIFPGQFIVTFTLVTDKFKELTEHLVLSWSTMAKVRDIFAGFFAVLDIGWAIIKGVATVIGDLLKSLFPAGSGLLSAGAAAGTFLQKLDLLLVKGGKIQDFFNRLGMILTSVTRVISGLIVKVVDFFGGGIKDSLSSIFGGIKGHVGDLSSGVDHAQNVWDKFLDVIKGVVHVLDVVFDAIRNWFHELFHKIAEEMQPKDFNGALDAVNVGLLGAITLMLKKFFAGGLKFGFGGGVFNNIKNALNNVTRSFQLMQTQLKAEALLKIAEAIGIVAIAVLLLASVNSADLTKALAAMSVGFGQLAATLLVMDKVVGTIGGAAQIGILSGALIGLATAMVIFAVAIRVLAKLSWQELAKGLIGVGVGMGIMVAAVKLLDSDKEGLARAGVSIAIIGFGLRILADAVKAFGSLDLEQLAKGLGAVAVSLVILVKGLNSLDVKDAIGTGIAIGIIAVALRILADVVQEFSKLSFTELAKGIGALAVTLLILVIAVNALDANAIGILAAGGAMIAIAVALRIIADVLVVLGRVPFGTMAKAIGELAVILLILVVAMNAMDGALPGAIALVVVSGALVVLSKVLEQLGQLSFKEIVTALAAIAGVLLLFGVAALVLEPVLPALAILGAVLTSIGLGLALMGAGAFLAVTALALFATVGVAGLKALISAVPLLAVAGADLIIQFTTNLAKGIPTIIKTVQAILEQLLDTIIKIVPKIAEALATIISQTVLLFQDQFPLLVTVGFQMLEALLQGISDNIGAVTDSVVNIFANFSKAVVDNMPQIVTSAANIIISFLAELGNHAEDIATAAAGLIISVIAGIAGADEQVITAVVNLVISIVTELGNHVVELLGAGAKVLANILTGIANTLDTIADTVTNIVVKFTTELGTHVKELVTAGANLVLTVIFGIAASIIHFVDAAGQCILSFLTALDSAVKKYEPQIISKGIQIGVDIISGIFFGVANAPALKDISNFFFNLGNFVVTAVKNIGGWVERIGHDIVAGIWNGILKRTAQFAADIVQWVNDNIPSPIRRILNILSPSKVMAEIGGHIVDGLLLGITSQAQKTKDTVSTFADGIVSGLTPDTKDLSTVLANLAASLGDMQDFNPTITPVLDLSKIQEGASGISGILGAGSITPDISTQNATIISASTTAKAGTSSADATTPSGDVIFSQTINAPTALSTDDIYRNTKSQITLAKEELKIS